ncbi:MAG: right-handed parallel beta-helix repeat-containing protein, partial [Candidatus Omnitrophica bacterium]|nr:right-handed parallel beta-helix repeat-containing protein [Candidatus Omnitrophota bacterium]
DFYDETTLPCKGLDFFPGTILTVNPASHVKMGFDTVLLSEGEFYCSGTETEKITIEPITTEGIRIAPMNTGTGRILVHSLEESLEFKYLILKYTDFHVIPPADNISINLNMANNNLTTSMLSVVSYGGNVDLQNNYMKGGYRPIWVYAIQDTGSSTTLNIRNNEVDHIYYEDRPVEYYGSSPYRNSSDGGYGIFVDMLGLGPAYQTIENNIVRNTWFAGIMYRGYKSNTEGYMRIKNNFVDSGDGARGIAIVSTTTPPRGMKHQMIIANNEVKNVTAKWWTSFYFDGGIAVQYTPSDDIEIKNNEIYDCRYGIKLTGTDAVIKNNVLYNNDTADIAKNLRTKSGMTIENNTIYDNKAGGNSIYGDDGSIKNCIVWGTGAKIGGKLNKKVTYSDAKGITKGKGNIIPAEDPMFESPASADFRLKVGSPCINKGDPKSQYNDPDRTRNDMGAYGGPGAADGVGPQPPPGG